MGRIGRIGQRRRERGSTETEARDGTQGEYEVEVPLLSVHSVETRLVVPFGHTICMIDRIVRRDVTVSEEVPYLSKLPFVGRSFRTEKTKRDYRVLVVLVAPSRPE